MIRFLPILLFLREAIASSCDAEPLVLPIRSVQVYPDIKDSYMIGIPAEIGTPPQNLVLLPWADLNNTWIYNTEPHCGTETIINDRVCKVRRGGLFNEEYSTSFNNFSNIVDAGGAEDGTVVKGGTYGVRKLSEDGRGAKDKFKLESSVALQDFPFGIPTSEWDNEPSTQSPLGLGRNSTYLNALRKAGKITSRVWSIFWGRMWTSNDLEGSLMLGGYDEKKVTGENYTAPLVFGNFDAKDGCWTGMRVTVTDIKVNFVGGTNASIVPTGTTLQCCIDPTHNLLLDAPNEYIENFEHISGLETNSSSSGLHWGASQTDLKKPFLADLTFYLESGLEIRFPNDQYMVPFVDIDTDGSRVIDTSKRDILMKGIEDEAPTLGRYFLTAAYLMVNHDAGTFTLWKANATKESNPVRVFDEEAGKQCGDKATGVIQPSAYGTASTSGTSDPENDGDDSKSKPSPSGAVIGGAVAGAILGAALIGSGVVYMLYQKRTKAKDTYYYYPAQEDMQRTEVHEMDSTPRDITEYPSKFGS
ncbi:aspartic peptidase domain-containing protein [Fusarium avenaceum]|nr:aspartic peptidase domain-containing protein [Fusarium avenaceum]